MSFPILGDLLAIGECEWIDFKEMHHVNKADLVHDVMCLANADHDGDRYLIFGVRDSDNVTVGVEADVGRRRPPDVINLFQSLRINQVPYLKLVSLTYEGHEVDLLIIKNMPEKPYFLLQEYVDGRERVRAGAIYLRVGDTNTPKDRTADDVRVERMYRQRFGIDSPPLERVRTYLKDIKSWKRDYAEENRQFFRYEPFPEFTLIAASEADDRDFEESWIHVFPDDRASRDLYYLKYHATILDKVYLVWCDGARYVTVMPESWINNPHMDNDLRQSFYFVADSMDALINDMLQQLYPVHSRTYIGEGFSVFESQEEAERLLAADLVTGARQYTFYRFDVAEQKNYQIRNGEERRIGGYRTPS